MRQCPLCGSKKRVEYPYKTYKTCAQCQHTYQPRPPQKTYQNPDEECNGGLNAVMGNHEKAINQWIAQWLFSRARPTRALDIGCAYPYMSGCLSQMGVEAHAVDGVYKDTSFVSDEHTKLVKVSGIDWEDPNDGDLGKFDLITLIHIVEHFKYPIPCLKRVYDSLTDDGMLYLRAPNKDISGIERDHTEGHTLIHPNIFGSQSLIYAAQKVGFHLHWVEHMHGHGQSSWIFKKRPPTLSLFMIVKNEEENLADCLDTIKDSVEEIIILDTGSTDKTIDIARSMGAKVFNSKQFTSETKIEDFSFSRARNEAMRHATGDWLVWMDADDRLINDEMIFSPEFDAYYATIKYGNTSYHQCRFFRNYWGVHFSGAVHEFAVIDNCRLGTMQRCVFEHLPGEKPGRIDRNLSILNKEYQNDPTNKRTLFYLANANREAGEHEQAVIYYKGYIESGGNFHDEVALAHYYLALSHYCQSKYDLALKAAHEAMAFDDKWGEPYALAGECYYFKGQYRKAISYLTIAYEMPFPKTTMFVEKNRYREAPRLWISHCYEKLGDLEKAREWAKGDLKREKELSQRTYVIEVRRPGALGDVLCTTPAVRELRKKHPKAHIRYVTNEHSFPILKCNSDIDEVVQDDPNRYADLRIEFAYPLNEGYPYLPLKRHLVQYFAECAGVELSDNRPVINLLPDDLVKLEHKKPIITFAVKTGWSEYKEWPLERWEKLIGLFPEYQFIQLGAPNEPQIKGAQYMCGKLSIRESFSVLQQSELFIGLDSLFNHASKALGTPAVVMFGSTSPIGSGYDVNINLWSEYECSPCYRENNNISAHPMPPCPYSHKCMIDYMTVERVADAVKQKLQRLLPVVNK